MTGCLDNHLSSPHREKGDSTLTGPPGLSREPGFHLLKAIYKEAPLTPAGRGGGGWYQSRPVTRCHWLIAGDHVGYRDAHPAQQSQGVPRGCQERQSGDLDTHLRWHEGALSPPACQGGVRETQLKQKELGVKTKKTIGKEMGNIHENRLIMAPAS